MFKPVQISVWKAGINKFFSHISMYAVSSLILFCALLLSAEVWFFVFFVRNNDNHYGLEWQHKHVGSIPGWPIYCMVLSQCRVCRPGHLAKNTSWERFQVLTHSWNKIRHCQIITKIENAPLQVHIVLNYLLTCELSIKLWSVLSSGIILFCFQWFWEESSDC